MRMIYQKIQLNKYPVGHLKFLLNGEKKISFTSISSEEIKEKAANIAEGKTSYSTLLINARVQTRPAILSQLISESIEESASKFNGRICVKTMASFQPGYPKPTHRLID